MNRFRALIALILLAAVSGGPALAQEKMVLTLEDCLKLALAQNPFYLAARAKEDQAEASLKEAVAGFFPTLNASGTDVLDKKVFTIEFPSFIPGGSPTRVKMDFTRAYTFALSFSLPLYSGGRLVAGYKTANYNLEATREAIRQSRRRWSSTSRSLFTAISWPAPSSEWPRKAWPWPRSTIPTSRISPRWAWPRSSTFSGRKSSWPTSSRSSSGPAMPWPPPKSA